MWIYQSPDSIDSHGKSDQNVTHYSFIINSEVPKSGVGILRNDVQIIADELLAKRCCIVTRIYTDYRGNVDISKSGFDCQSWEIG